MVNKDVLCVVRYESSIDLESLHSFAPVINEEACIVISSLFKVRTFLCQSEVDLDSSMESLPSFG